MIFVTMGTGHYGFDRLVREMDQIAASINETVLMQIGNTDYEPQNAEFFRFCSPQQLEQYVRDSRLVVSHVGVGTIMLLLKLAKPFILVPRMRKYGENIDDNQVETAEPLEKEGVIVVYETGDLKGLLGMANAKHLHISSDGGEALALALKEYFRGLETQVQGH